MTKIWVRSSHRCKSLETELGLVNMVKKINRLSWFRPCVGQYRPVLRDEISEMISHKTPSWIIDARVFLLVLCVNSRLIYPVHTFNHYRCCCSTSFCLHQSSKGLIIWSDRGSSPELLDRKRWCFYRRNQVCGFGKMLVSLICDFSCKNKRLTCLWHENLWRITCCVFLLSFDGFSSIHSMLCSCIDVTWIIC